MKSIPSPIYPLAIDNDYTLFSTHNSSQSVLAEDLDKIADIITIVPQDANAQDMWADNGFVTIKDELIYYDSVLKNESGKIYQLKDCIRGIEGQPDYYHAGLPIAANAIAQTHNQLVDTIIAIEDAIGDVNDILKIGPELKTQQLVKKNLLPVPKRNSIADVDFAFTASLHQSMTAMLGCCGSVGDDVCPDVEFEFNVLGNAPGSLAEYCIRIFGSYTSFNLDFGNGISQNTKLAGTYVYPGAGPYKPILTVNSANCTIMQKPTAPDDCEGLSLPNPSVPFFIAIPDIPEFPEFVAPKQICPGPLLNLPPIIMDQISLCPSQISICPQGCCISVISIVGCCPPSIISIVGCCPPSIISIVSPCISFCEPPSICVSFCAPPNFSCVSFCPPPSFDCISFCAFPSIAPVSFTVGISCISFCQIPSFNCISFCIPPSFNSISFSPAPSFACISFCPFPSIAPVSFTVGINLSTSCISFCQIPSFDCISFCQVPSFNCVSFCPPPSFACISFCPPPSFDCISFCTPPPLSVIWGVPPVVSCIVQVVCPSSSIAPSVTCDGDGDSDDPVAMSPFGMAAPITFNNDIGIPEEIRLIVPKIADVKVVHDVPKEIRIIGQSIPDSIVLTHNLPAKIFLDATDIPRKILLEPASNFPSVLRMEIIGMPQTLQVTGIPKTIEIIENIPRTIQLLMPDNPVVEMRWSGAPLELKPSLDLEKLLSNLVIPPR
jgi:hypothetical protein